MAKEAQYAEETRARLHGFLRRKKMREYRRLHPDDSQFNSSSDESSSFSSRSETSNGNEAPSDVSSCLVQSSAFPNKAREGEQVLEEA